MSFFLLNLLVARHELLVSPPPLAPARCPGIRLRMLQSANAD